jgi:hypothetical protein
MSRRYTKRNPPVQIVCDALLLVSEYVPLATIRGWTVRQRELAYEWAFRTHLIASDNDNVKNIKKPACVTRDAKPLEFDGVWPVIPAGAREAQ